MKKFFTISHILDLLALSTFGLLLLDAVFYSGFGQKHFFVDSKKLFIFYIIFSVIFFSIKKYTISPVLYKLNKILLPLVLVSACLFQYLEDSNYVNFVYTKFHINPINFLALPLFSGFIFFLNNPILFRKYFYFLIPLFSSALSQIISFDLGFRYNIFSNLLAYFVNYFLWLTVLLFCTSIFRKKSHSAILYLSFFSLFTLINHFKIKYLNLFFIVSDFLLIKHNSQYLSEMFLQFELFDLIKMIICLILLIFISVFIKKKLTTTNPKFKIRFILFVISGFVFTFPIFFPIHFKTILNKLKIETYLWGPIENCTNNGIFFCFYDDLKNITNPAPSDYSQQTINQIHADSKSLLSSRDALEPVDRGGFKPNIIVILSEALWDITKLPNVQFSTDPIANIRKDIKSTLISPTIGTATANVEFEFLTGLSNYFLNGVVPYSQAVRKDLPTLFTSFKEMGYLTTTIHPYFAAMYNRPQVYKNFGLDKYISMENMTDYEYAGAFISDKSLTQEILKQYNSTTAPQFIFGMSMQNHYPFETDRFSSHDIKITTTLSADNKNIIQTYTDGINLSDKAYQTLKSEIAKSNRPTIIILYGDHLPLLNPGLGLYQDAKYDTSDQTKMHSTPIAMWSNYPVKLQPKSYLSPSFLGLEILDLAKIKPKNQFSYLKSISLTDTVLHSNLKPKFTPQQLNDYELIQYDLIYGKQYSLK